MTVSIKGTGSYLPSRVMKNTDLEKMVSTTDEWIVTRTGITERRIAAEDEAVSDMAAVAARGALESAGIAARDVDAIIVATATPDMPFPSSACLVQHLIGAKRAFSFDIEAACSGFVYALETGRCLIQAGSARTVLVIGSEKFSSITDWQDRNTCILFGDGAGAVVLQASDAGRGLIATALHSDGGLGDMLKVPGGGSRRPASEQMMADRLQYITMNGREVFKHAVRCMTEVGLEVLASSGIAVKDIDWIVPHQANIRIIEAVADRLGTGMDKFYVNLDRVGNISAASIPLALDEGIRSGKIKKGQLILLTALGAGMTWGACVLEL
ncbi:MAG: ketoacyl-ACP synthase III [Lentisphaerales bacterium]|nr:MAG: ketoacyl-ACP synthase III [Lentisphaerales bacterium]